MNTKLTLLNRRLVVEASGTALKTIFRELGLMAEIKWEPWNRQVKVQQVELNCIAEFADRMKNLQPATEGLIP
jgi:hypothetical protein